MKKILKILGVVFAFFIIIAALSGGGGETKNGKNAEGNTEQEFQNQEITEENVNLALLNPDKILREDEISRVEVADYFPDEYDVSEELFKEAEGGSVDKIVTIYYKPGITWNEKDLLRKTVDTTVKASKRLFSNQRLGFLTIVTEGDFTDQYGNTETRDAVKVGLSKETVSKINWENFEDMVYVDYKKLFEIADSQYLHPSVQRTLEE